MNDGVFAKVRAVGESLATARAVVGLDPVVDGEVFDELPALCKRLAARQAQVRSVHRVLAPVRLQ